MTPWARSGAFAATIFAVGLFGAVSPILLRERRGAHRERLLSLGSVFGAGVFLSAGFVHMLADAAQDLDGGGYPWAMLVCSAALLALMLFENAVKPRPDPDARPLGGRAAARASGDGEGEGEGEGVRLAETSEGAKRADRLPGDPCTAALMFGALSFHSFVAGLSLGASPARVAVFVAIVAHKGFASFALGTRFVQTRGAGRRGAPALSAGAVAAWMALFALVTPAGVLAGTALRGAGAGSQAAAHLTAAAAGTFIYVALAEVALPEFAKPGDARAKALFLLLGYAGMSALAIWV